MLIHFFLFGFLQMKSAFCPWVRSVMSMMLYKMNATMWAATKSVGLCYRGATTIPKGKSSESQKLERYCRQAQKLQGWKMRIFPETRYQASYWFLQIAVVSIPKPAHLQKGENQGNNDPNGNSKFDVKIDDSVHLTGPIEIEEQGRVVAVEINQFLEEQRGFNLRFWTICTLHRVCGSVNLG